MSKGFESPEEAVSALVAAYQALDLEAIIDAKDFAVDSRAFWEDLDIPINDKQKAESVAAFEANFRKQIEDEGIADYRGMRYTVGSRQNLKDDLVLLTLDCVLQDGQNTQMRLPTFKTESGWKVVLIPGYDHL